jgi:hypothetical protein
MAKPISELLNRLPAERQAAIKAKTDAILTQMELQVSVNKSNVQGGIKN